VFVAERRRDHSSTRRFRRGALLGFAVGVLTLASPVAAQEDPVSATRTDTLAIVDSLQAATDTIQESHPQDSPDQAGFIFATSDGKGSFRLRASIRLNGAWDGSGLQSTDVFDTYLIPVGFTETPEQARFFMQATQTRFGFELNRDTGRGIVYGRIEADFRGTDNSLRLRHAYGEFWKVSVGQTWSTFTDVSTLPVTVDFEGPPSSNSVRTPQVRFTTRPLANWTTSVALEAPQVDATVSNDSVSGTSASFQGFGDIAARARLELGWGHLTFSTIFRSITLQSTERETQFLPGLGFQFSGRLDLDDEDQLLFQAIGGRAISRFVGSLGEKGLDLLLNPQTGRWVVVRSYGGYLTYSHRWIRIAPDLISNFTVGAMGILNEDFESDDAFRNSFYFSGNGFWRITEGTRVGSEISWGARYNKDGQSGSAIRFSFAAYLDF
jgi:hypothetical protein